LAQKAQSIILYDINRLANGECLTAAEVVVDVDPSNDDIIDLGAAAPSDVNKGGNGHGNKLKSKYHIECFQSGYKEKLTSSYNDRGFFVVSENCDERGLECQGNAVIAKG
jgi:hypothetical protein